MRCVLASLGLSASLLGCGVAVHGGHDAGQSADGVDADASSSDRPSIVGIVGPDAAPPPIACEPCSTSGECGEAGAACVAGDGGGGYCAPGCNKEGYCTPDRVCEAVSDPSGRSWAACLPLSGCEGVP